MPAASYIEPVAPRAEALRAAGQITAFIAMVDQYRAFGNETYLEAATGAWEMLHGSFEHVRIPKHVG